MSARAWKRRRNKATWYWLTAVVSRVYADTGTRFSMTLMGMKVSAGEWRPMRYFSTGTVRLLGIDGRTLIVDDLGNDPVTEYRWELRMKA